VSPSLESERVQQVRVELGLLPAADRLAVWRAAMAPIFEITPDPADANAPLAGELTLAHLGDALIAECHAGSQTFGRSSAYARRSGLDHFMVQTFLSGGHDADDGRRVARHNKGDVAIFDLAQMVTTRTVPFANLSLIIPRDRVPPRRAGGSVGGMTWPRGSTSARLIASHLKIVTAAAPHMTLAEAAIAVDAAALMISGESSCVRDGSPQAITAVRASARRAVGEYIDQHLTDTDLSPDALIRVFGLSRATLYRLFENEGGVAGYIVGRRLDRCYALLTTVPNGRTITSLAYDHGFSSETYFGRAFRRRFGMTPREARGLRAQPPDRYGSAAYAAVITPAAKTVANWLCMLRGQPAREAEG
jgi:AraC-like DNA-binding protein